MTFLEIDLDRSKIKLFLNIGELYKLCCCYYEYGRRYLKQWLDSRSKAFLGKKYVYIQEFHVGHMKNN